MATSGSYSYSFGTNGGYSIVLEWKRNSVDITNNKSNVTVTAYLRSNGSYYTIVSSATKNGTITINGTSYSFSFSASLSANQKKQIVSKTVDIAHNSDGTKSFNMSVNAGIAVTLSGNYIASVSTSGTGTLDTIPRTSSFTLSTTNATLGSTSVTVNISRASSSFTHKVYVVFGSNTTTYSTNATTSVSFTPNINLCSQIPNATSGTATIYVQTLNGSTVIGTVSKTITYNVPSSVVPTLSGLSASVVASGADTSYGYVKGKSKAQLVINGASGSYGSTIKSYKITGNGSTITSSSGTTGILNSAGTFTYTATVTDSRGRTSSGKTVSITVQDYSAPKITGFTAIRCTSDGTASDSGTFVKVTANYSYTSLSGKNSISNKVYGKVSTSSTYNELGTVSSGSSVVLAGGSIATSNSYDVKLTITDKFGSVSKIVNISPQFVTMDFKAGGKGVAIGKASTSDKLEVEMETQLNNRLCFKKGKWIHYANAGSGTSGYLKICNIQVIGGYINQPIRMTIAQRNQMEIGTLNIRFSNTDSLSPSINTFTSTGQINAYIHNSSSGVFDLYVLKTESYDTIDVVDVDLGVYNNQRCTVNWLNELVTSLPSGYVSSTGLTSLYTYNGEARIGFYKNGTQGVYMYGQDSGRVGFYDSINSKHVWNYQVDSGTGSFRIAQHTYPVSNNSLDIGSSSLRWRTIYSVNTLNTSDKKYKENIEYIDVNSDTKNISNNISQEDIYSFYKDTFKLARYNYKEQEYKEYGFIAQDLAEDNVGKTIVIDDEEGYMYSVGSYISSIAGALQYEINLRDEQIKELDSKLEKLEQLLLNK